MSTHRPAIKREPVPELGVRRRGRTLAEGVVEAFVAKIRGGAYAAGDRLPTEAEMTAAFDVSRTVVREAVSRLEAMGLADTRHGVGTFVVAQRSSAAAKPDSPGAVTIRDVLAMLEFRTSVEVEAAALAAARRSKTQLARIERVLADLEHAVASGSDAIKSDFEFHFEIAAATGNAYFQRSLAQLDTTAIPRTRLDTARLSSEPLTTYLQRVNLEHRAIFEAIVRKDSDASRAAMRLHLTNSMERLRQASRAQPALPR